MSVLPKLICVLFCLLALSSWESCKTSGWSGVVTWRVSVRRGGGNPVLTLVASSWTWRFCQYIYHLVSGQAATPTVCIKAAILTVAPQPLERRMCSRRPGGSPRGINPITSLACRSLPLLAPPWVQKPWSLLGSALKFLNVVSHLFSFSL